MKRHLAAACVLTAAMTYGACEEAEASTPAEVLASAVSVGNDYWATHKYEAHPYTPCAAVSFTTTRHIVQTVPGETVLGWFEDCKVQIDRRTLVDAWRWPRFRPTSIMLCLLVTHELGHAYGFEHSAVGVMAALLTPRNAPRVCFDWAHSR